MKIGIVGSHMVGKTTLIDYFCTLCKNVLPDFNIYKLEEIPTKLVSESKDMTLLRENNTLTIQFYLLIRQLVDESRLRNGEYETNELICCDRTVIDHWVYTLCLHGKEITNTEKILLNNIIIEYSKCYDFIIYIPIEFTPNNELSYEEINFRIQIDKCLKKLLKKINHVRIAGSVYERAYSIVSLMQRGHH